MDFSIQYCAEGCVQVVVRLKTLRENVEFVGININPEVPFIMAGPHVYFVQSLRRSQA